MPFSLEQVVPWGRSFDEYERMFALTRDDLSQPILGCGDGPASFNAEARRRGISVTSCDPIYAFTAQQIRRRIDATSAEVVEQMRRNADQFVWTTIGSVEDLISMRRSSMDAFLSDYAAATGRYVAAALPALPFRDRTFRLALSSHLLFLYSAQFDLDAHRRSLADMCRVADEVRVFPLLALDGRRSPHVAPLIDALTAAGDHVQIETVPYEFQRGGNQMLRLRHRR
jgi:hypothetical protein